jgi:hypothetical protein
VRLLERGRTGLDAHPPGDLAHRLEQRQGAVGAGDGLVGDCGDPGPDQVGGLLGIWREVEVGVEHLAFVELGALAGLGLLDLHHHLAFGEDLVGSGDDLGPGRTILGVVRADADPRAAFDPHGVAVLDQFLGALGRQPDAELLVLDFARAADQHGAISFGQVVTRDTTFAQLAGLA